MFANIDNKARNAVFNVNFATFETGLDKKIVTMMSFLKENIVTTTTYYFMVLVLRLFYKRNGIL